MSDTFARLLAATRIDIDNLRDSATEHHREAVALDEQLTEPTAHLERLAAEEADLVRKLEALRLEMVDVRKAYDVMAAERDRHRNAAASDTAAAAYYEQRTIPDLQAMLQDAPPPQVLADPPPHDHGPDEPPFNVTQAPPEVVAAITGGTPVVGELVATGGPTETGPITPPSPVVTMPDLGVNVPDEQPAEQRAEATGEPRHAKPKKSIEWSGAFKAITGRLADPDGAA